MGNCIKSNGTGVAPSEKPVVCVFGCSGNVGAATVRALSARFGDKVDIRAGVRESSKEKAASLGELAGVTVVTAVMGDQENLATALKGVDVIFVTVPPTEDRADLSIRTMEAGKEAGVKHAVVVSTPSAGLDILFGKQFEDLETRTKALDLSYTILRLPMFVDNYWGFKEGIANQSKIFCPVDPEKPYCPVVVDDVGRAAATVMTSHEQHKNITYTIISNRHTYAELAEAFSEALGREIEYERVPYEAGKKAFMGMGMPEWQAGGAMELMQLIDNGSPISDIADMGDYKKITGEEPTDLKSWVMSVHQAFQSSEQASE